MGRGRPAPPEDLEFGEPECGHANNTGERVLKCGKAQDHGTTQHFDLVNQIPWPNRKDGP